jgi:SAM-dependent methyltransferase
MKLSSVVAYKNLLDSMTPLAAIPIAHDKLAPILEVVQKNEIQIRNLSNQLTSDYKYVVQTLSNFEQTLEDLKAETLELIIQNEAAYYEESSRRYETALSDETVEYILDRRVLVFPELLDKLVTRIRAHSDWHHAGMIIRPGREDWIQELVGLDPLYLVDHNMQLLEPAVLRFNDHYKKRLRTYAIREDTINPMFETIPDNQFGFIFAWNFFNYKPIEVIEKYLLELYTKLKPGGTLAFTFNDCDRHEGVELFEKIFMSYTPGRCVLDLARKIGYAVTYNFRTDAACTWLEIQRPGVLSSLRGGQSLAKVLYKDEYYHYNNEQIENIKQHASDLNIARPEELNNMPIGHIVELIKQRTSK